MGNLCLLIEIKVQLGNAGCMDDCKMRQLSIENLNHTYSPPRFKNSKYPAGEHTGIKINVENLEGMAFSK